jgi:hypothetical protein
MPDETLSAWTTSMLWRKWVSEEPIALLCRDDLSWESLEAPFAEPASDKDEEVVAIDDFKEALVASLTWSAADGLYCPQPDQEPYLYVVVTQDCLA